MTVFLVIGLVGLALLTVTLGFGDLFDGVFAALAGDWFSGAVIGGFVSAFGFGAALAEGSGAPSPAVIAIGVGAGAVFAWFGAWLTRFLKGGEDATLKTDDVVGMDATVVAAIPDGGFGTVTVRVAGQTVRYNARAEAPITSGTEVHVTGVLSPTAVSVAPLWTPLDPS